MLDDQVTTIGQAHRTPEQRFDLFFKTELLEQLILTIVQFQDILLFRSNVVNVGFDIIVNLLRIHGNAVE
ncbi:hypothetical protein D3C86_1957830 [compost metagenome]